jgi:micrococcal nuclease
MLFACSGGTQDTSLLDTDTEESNIIEEIDDLSWVDPSDLPAAEQPCREPIRMEVTYVADGDTFFAKSSEGEEKIRIIGIDTPELQDDECYSQEAKSFLFDLIDDKWVWLTFDQVCYDQYDRTLAYVHLGTQEMDFIERQILLEGYALAFPFSDTSTFSTLFAFDEAEARANNKGGWDVCDW